MNAYDILRLIVLQLPTRQLRRSHQRLARGAQRREQTRFAHESLETRAMMTAALPSYQLVQDWGTGFQAGITLANQGTTPIADWKVSFDSSAQISSVWDAKIVSHVGSTYTISNAGWNGTLEAGRSVAFGFIGAGAGSAAPHNWKINGEPIGGAATPAPSPLPEITVTGGSVAEGAAGGTAQAVFALSLSAPSSVPVTVRFTTVDGTAKAGADYAATTGLVTFPAGTTRQELRVAVTGDATVEPDEVFTLALSSPQGATLRQTSAVATILNDDAAVASQGAGVVFTVTSKWETGFQGEIVLKNSTTTAINGWKLGFTAPWSVAAVWNGLLVSKTALTGGTRFVVGDSGWNAAVPAGGSVSIGFTGTYAGSIATPIDWTLNGLPLGNTPTPTPTP
ncbi:MAG: cellulose binding domain-containing protein, partial [Planctomycetes bacterium]|nr:cellulose binding domain-containing protein [Planctomycetota bacterium]